ncbi:hypothetical protein BAY1663_03808 [Pseudomonas sp. BAY1663]|nr:hypothetical protein BAY1663_03808 [Pseudomonas sp. BAY1663]
MDALAVRWGLENGEAGRVCESDLGCDALPLSAQTPAFGATLSSAGTTGCASHGASLFLVWPRKSNQKEGHPYIRTGRPRFAAQNFPRFDAAPGVGLGAPSRKAVPGPSLLARHPCLATPYATPKLGLLKGIRDRGAWKCPSNESKKSLRLFLRARPDRRHQTPLSEGRMESLRRGASGMDAARAVKGHGWPLRGDSEQRWSEGSRAQRDPDAGARPFGSFWGDCQKGLAQQGETNASANPANRH